MIIGYDAKRVLHNFTGLGNYSRYVISNIRKQFPDNQYRLFVQRLSFSPKLDEEFKDTRLYVWNQKHKRFWRSWRIIDEIAEEKLTIFHGLSNELPFQINRVAAKSVVTIHDLIFLRYPRFYPFIDRIIYHVKAKYACHVADRIVAVSECTKRDIIHYYKIPPEKIDVVYQGCFADFKVRRTAEENKAVRAKYDLPEHYILSVGSIEERKNILLVIKALRELPDVHFVAVGKPRKYFQRLMKYVKQHGLENRVHFRDQVLLGDLPSVLQSADVFVYPSLYEGFGIPIVEALSSGVPVIGAKGSCLEEAGGSGSIYVDPYDAHELASQIRRILSDKLLAESMVQNGYAYVKRFSDERCTDNLMKVYESVLR